MPTVEFAPALTRHVACPPQKLEAAGCGRAACRRDSAFRWWRTRSEDAGAVWHCVSRDLPPIAVLRWA